MTERTDARDIVLLRAVDQAAMLRRREISATELLEAHLDQIERTNPELNAIVTLTPERAFELAAAADDRLSEGGSIPLLTGLPVAHKDLHETAGIRTTFGSRVYRNYVPTRNALIVQRQLDAGAVTVGKTNAPEHGAGNQTFNEVFGVTRNPWDLSLTPGGSSGGAAVAVAAGMVSLADGSDHGASLRNPASFTNTVGFRPSPGRIPTWPSKDVWWTQSVHGPMARTVEDIALFMAATAGPDPRIPVSIDQPASSFATPLQADWSGVTLAWSDDLGGLPVEPEVTTALQPARAALEDVGFTVIDAEPDFKGAEEVFQVFRGLSFVREFGDAVRSDPDSYKETIHWNTEYGRSLTAADIGKAAEARTRLFNRVARFLDEHRFLALPASAVPPFSVETEYPREIAGVKQENYTSWFACCYYISAIGLPAISVPAGFTDDGLPVGLQIVGRHRADLDVLRAAFVFQQATMLWQRHPPSVLA
ncbi:MAG: amidase family protein [Acidimicrobiia bacterium]|nr:amidase family protein [Acidimicrobiia bacterium]